MSDPNSSDGIRRLRRADRKKAIQARGPLFPPEPEGDLRFAPPELQAAAQQPSRTDAPVEPPLAAPQPAPSQPVAQTHRGACLPNLVALGFALATVAAMGLIALIALNPYSPLNPFPPFTPLPILITATFLPPTATVPSLAVTATFTPLAAEPAQVFALSLPQGVVYQPNANAEGCNWSSIAGSVAGADNVALDGYRVKISGQGIENTIFSGTTAAFGAGGFELFLNGTPQVAAYTVQVFDLQGQPASAPVEVTMQADCAANVALLNFRAG